MLPTCPRNHQDVLGRDRAALAGPKDFPNQAFYTVSYDGIPHAPTHGDAEARPASRRRAPDDDERRGVPSLAVALEREELGAAA
jgi:hypothetical protein